MSTEATEELRGVAGIIESIRAIAREEVERQLGPNWIKVEPADEVPKPLSRRVLLECAVATLDWAVTNDGVDLAGAAALAREYRELAAMATHI